MRRVLILGTLLLMTSPVHGQERRPPELLLRRGGDTYEAPHLRSRGQVDVGRDTGSRYRGVYDRSGRRIGTVERTPYGSNTFRDNQGRRQ